MTKLGDFDAITRRLLARAAGRRPWSQYWMQVAERDQSRRVPNVGAYVGCR